MTRTQAQIDPLVELEYFKRLWKASMPECIETPADSIFMTWIITGDRHIVTQAITKAGRRMVNNINQKIPLVENAAARYCTSIIINWRNAEKPFTVRVGNPGEGKSGRTEINGNKEGL